MQPIDGTVDYFTGETICMIVAAFILMAVDDRLSRIADLRKNQSVNQFV